MVDFVTTKNGGDGAIREMIEFILKKDYDKKLVDLWV
jgi:3-deoxy-D-manno-octulosonate 8-phosphate phosphatase KdsC-like HAD superfamily phosphatase